MKSPIQSAMSKRLISLPVSDHRKFAISLILTPYFVNVRRLSEEDSFRTIKRWALRSDKLRKLEPSMEYFDNLIGGAIRRCIRNPSIKPLNFEKTLRHKNVALHTLLR